MSVTIHTSGNAWPMAFYSNYDTGMNLTYLKLRSKD